MPKAGNSKKRKREKKKDEESSPKKAKSKDDDEGAEKGSDDEDSKLPGEEEQQIEDIDEMLEENAAKNNLTAINVKSILHVSLLTYRLLYRVYVWLNFSSEVLRLFADDV